MSKSFHSQLGHQPAAVVGDLSPISEHVQKFGFFVCNILDFPCATSSTQILLCFKMFTSPQSQNLKCFSALLHPPESFHLNLFNFHFPPLPGLMSWDHICPMKHANDKKGKFWQWTFCYFEYFDKIPGVESLCAN